ncbi:MAG: DUF4743 domain-containing protein [Gammaproteobacteria bacterium]|jgi:isopentenyldiphosphate isomerase|nr:DUF4743 domain-containing protein [Gammaproteobacteria bacterium]MBT3724542.1 DUF4743 domain-containing protein [Gammaproteobacteria bacterium]MBT4077143.1 DUF4743 domain-containing protein [Gammaproteobacteria bacterium]MBT4193169.1 DUF4743 domain-containing protein [Gammaproteobacteria bacterium]MBT4450304.1 DUF4743 domain-containing protein [Gammaproteobacteria bacterium]
MSYLHQIQQCNLYQPDHFIPFKIAGLKVGEIKHPFAQSLLEISDAFHKDHNALHWNTPATDFASRNQAMFELTEKLLEANLVPYLHGELYPVTTGQREQVLFLMDRALVSYFGVAAFGQHMNGYVRRQGEIHMWIARRSLQKRHAPGMLDHLVAGGFPWGLSSDENLAKECWEEAGIPAELAAQAKHVGKISYRREVEQGLKPDTMLCYDLELPEDFIPRCTDGEVENFQLWPLERVAQTIQNSSDIKLNCNLVMIDFLIRHGYITRNHAEYSDLKNGLMKIPE